MKQHPEKYCDFDSQHELVLDINGLKIFLGGTQVVNGISFKVYKDQIVAIVGPNGAGKTTTLKAIAGVIKSIEGSIRFMGQPLENLPVFERVQKGIVYVPEGMQVFRFMTVLENLEIGGYQNRVHLKTQMEMVLELFPDLKDGLKKMARHLSGGQQRMLTIGRGLMSGARILLLDDPFLGLTPKAIDHLTETMEEVRARGFTLMIAGQHVKRIVAISDVVHLIEEGKITLSDTGKNILQDDHFQKTLFGTIF